MRTDYVDVYYPPVRPDTEPHAVAAQWGKERARAPYAWGVSNYTAAQLARAAGGGGGRGVPAPALCQPALSMLNTGALEGCCRCVKRGRGRGAVPAPAGRDADGQIPPGQEAPAAAAWRKAEWMKPFTDETYDVIERCAAEAAAEGVTMTQHALRWALAQPGVVSALVGVKREEQIDEAAGAVR
ncbi:MAG: aldo/keto reductase [Ruthenibacterium lactatiformans]